jgi:hypothetical protein
MRWTLLLLSLIAAAASGAAAPDTEPGSGNYLLFGKWTWTRTVNNCTEIYEYRPDDTMHVVSGAERSDNTYRLSPKPSGTGFYRFTATTVKDYGGKDCGDSSDDGTGSTYSAFIMFNPSGDGHIVCQQENFDNCFGPLRRLSD